MPKKRKLNVLINDGFFDLKIVMIDNEPWFVGKEVATMLGYKDTSDALKKHVDDEDMRFFKVCEMPTLKTSNYGAYLINESGLYLMIPAMHIEEDDALKRGLIYNMERMQKTRLINAGGLFDFVGLD